MLCSSLCTIKAYRQKTRAAHLVVHWSKSFRLLGPFGNTWTATDCPNVIFEMRDWRGLSWRQFHVRGIQKGIQGRNEAESGGTRNLQTKGRAVSCSLWLVKRFDQAATTFRRECTILRAPLPLDFWLRMNVTYGLESFKP